MQLVKYSNNPILKPNPENEWEALVSTNPAAWYDEENKEVILIYRAAGNDLQHRIHLGIAKSKNGYDFERVSDKPFFSTSEDNWDGGSVEDPRIVKFGDHYFITYAAVPIPPGQYWINHIRDIDKNLPVEAPIGLRENKTKTGLLITKDFKKVYRAGYLSDPVQDDRDVIIFPEKVNGKFVTLHRPAEWVGEAYGCEKASMWIAYSDDLLEHKNMELLAVPKYDWEYYKIGGSTPPIKTEAGWLTLYHGVGEDTKYRVGAMLLDLNDPRKVLKRTAEPILVPEFDFENVGIYKGICFPCGNVVIDGILYVYYGGADQYVGVATCPLDKLIEHLMMCEG